MKKVLNTSIILFAIVLFNSCGSSVTEADVQKAEEADQELKQINYDSITMPEASEEDTEDEEFDAESMLE